jgi:hypothetical protein
MSIATGPNTRQRQKALHGPHKHLTTGMVDPSSPRLELRLVAGFSARSGTVRFSHPLPPGKPRMRYGSGSSVTSMNDGLSYALNSDCNNSENHTGQVGREAQRSSGHA